jgi:phenylacetate-CoA ligase
VPGIDPWQAARSLHAAGIRAGDRVHNAFSYHLTPGGFVIDEGARSLGCIVFPAGVGNTEVQVEALLQLQATAYIGTPDYLQSLLDRAGELNLKLPHLSRALVSGGALFPAMRERYKEAGIQVSQAYAIADLGVIAYEVSTGGEVHPGLVVNEHLIVEIVRPGSNRPVNLGEVGEVVVTRLHPDYPLIRFATGDLSKELSEPSACGRTQKRIAGWMGRADQRTKVRGMFIDPVQIETIRQTHSEIEQARLIISRDDDRDTMTLRVWATSGSASTAVTSDSLQRTLQNVTKLKGNIEFMHNERPNDGLVIEDQRDYKQ